MCVRSCGSAGAVALGARLTLRFCRSGCAWCAPDIAALSRRLASVHACLFSFVRKKETACDILRSCSAGSRSPFARSRGVGAVICLGGFISGLYVSLWRSRRVTEDTRNGGTGERATGSAARPLCAFTLPHWLCCAFRREYVGAARPKPAPKSLRLSGLSSGAGRVRKCVLRGGVVLVRVRRAVIRALSET